MYYQNKGGHLHEDHFKRNRKKAAASLLGEYTNTKPQYLRAPSYAYQIGDLLLTREGNIEGPNTMSPAEYDKLLALLNASGYCPKETYFHPDQKPEAEATSTEETGLTIAIPLENVNIGTCEGANLALCILLNELN